MVTVGDGFGRVDDSGSGMAPEDVANAFEPFYRGKGAGKGIKRAVECPEFDPEKPIDEMRCLLEQGLMCMGPVTAGGCGGSGAPLCVRVRVPCRGCYGPVRTGGNPLLDLMNARAGQGVDRRSVVDRRSLLRFCGAHGLLRPVAGPR